MVEGGWAAVTSRDSPSLAGHTRFHVNETLGSKITPVIEECPGNFRVKHCTLKLHFKDEVMVQDPGLGRTPSASLDWRKSC